MRGKWVHGAGIRLVASAIFKQFFLDASKPELMKFPYPRAIYHVTFKTMIYLVTHMAMWRDMPLGYGKPRPWNSSTFEMILLTECIMQVVMPTTLYDPCE